MDYWGAKGYVGPPPLSNYWGGPGPPGPPPLPTPMLRSNGYHWQRDVSDEGQNSFIKDFGSTRRAFGYGHIHANNKDFVLCCVQIHYF